MENKKPLSDEQIEQVTGGTDPMNEEEESHMNDPLFHTRRSAECPYCGQTIPFSWWTEHMEDQHPGKPIP